MKKFFKHIAICFSLFFTIILSTACGGGSLAGIALSCPTLKELGKSYYAATIGQSFTVSVQTAPEDFDLTDKLIWQSDNTTVATVEDGVVTPKATGKANITAKYKDNENISSSVQIRVYTESSSELAFTQEYYTAIYGDPFEVDVVQDYDDIIFEFTGILENGTEYPENMKNVQPKEAGIYVVTTTYGDYRAEASIIISKREVEIPTLNYKKIYGSDSVTTGDGIISDDFTREGNEYIVELPNGGSDKIVYKLACEAVDTLTPANTTYKGVGTYPVTLEVDTDASVGFANNYRLKDSASGTLTIEPLAIVLVAKEKSNSYGSNTSFLTSSNYSIYRKAEFDITDPDDIDTLIDLAGSDFGNTFTSQISFATTIYKDDAPYQGKFNVGEYVLNCKGSQILAQNSKKNLTLTSSDIYNATYTITPRKLTIYPSAGQSKFAGEADPAFNYTTNSNGVVEGDTLLPFLTRMGADENINTPGEYNYDLITYGDPDNFVVNDNYEIELNTTNKFTIRENSIYFTLKGQVLNYGETADAFEYDITINGNKIEDPVVSPDGWITLQTYTYNQGDPDEITYTNKIKPTVMEDPFVEPESEGYYEKHRLILTWEFDENNEGYDATGPIDKFFTVTYNDVSPAFVCYNKLDLIVKPKAEPELLTKIYDNTVATDATIYEVECVGLYGADVEVFDYIIFKKTDTSVSVGTYPLDLIDYQLKHDKGYYNVILSDELVYYTVTQREIEIAPNIGQGKVYGSADKDITYTITNLAAGDTAENIIHSILILRTAGENVGEYSYALSTFTCDTNYTHKFNNLLPGGLEENKFAITQRQLNISAVSQTIIYGDEIPELGFVVSVEDVPDNAFINSYMPQITGALTTTAQKYSPIGDYPITMGTLDVNENFNIVFTEGKITVLKKSATFTVIAGEVESGVTPDVANIEYKFEGLIAGTTPEIGFTIKPDDETNPTKYALSGEVYGKNTTSTKLTFNHFDGTNYYNTLKLMFNDTDVVGCYDISIETTVAFYVSSLVINISIVSTEDLTTSIVETTYTGIPESDFFTVIIDDNKYTASPVDPVAGYTFNYEKPGSGVAVLIPVNAATYTVKLDLSSIKITNNETGEIVTPTLNISSYGSLIINKANLYYTNDINKPGVRPMEYGSIVLPTELVGRQLSTDPLEYDAVKIYRDPECTDLFPRGVVATYNTNVYTEAYIKSLTVVGSPYVISMTIVPREAIDQSNYNPIAINIDLVITPRRMDVSGANFTYTQGIKAAPYTNKVINNTLKMTTDDANLDKIGVSYSYVGVNYNATNPTYYGLIAYYENEIYVGDSANVKYFTRKDLEGANFTYDTTKNYMVATKGTTDYYLPLTHSSGVPINAGIYFVVANIRSTNGNYTISATSETQYKTIFEVTRSEDFELNGWTDEYMFGVSTTEIVQMFTFTTNPSKVKAYCTVAYELGSEVVCVDGTDIIAINAVDESYKVKVIVSTPNYYLEKDMEFRIVQLDAIITFPAADKYQYTGHEITSFIQNTKVTLVALDGSTQTVVYDEFSVDGPFGEPPMQVKYFVGLDEDDDGTPDTIGEELAGEPVEVGFYYMSCIYNDRTYYGEAGAFFEITKTFYTGSISFENASIAYDPFIALETAGGKTGLYDWILANMIKIPSDELDKVNYKKKSYSLGNAKPIQISVVMNTNEELKVTGPNAIKNCGTYRLKLILEFKDNITQTTTSEAILTINRVSLNTEAFVTSSPAYTYSGSNKYNEIRYSGATDSAIAIPVEGYETFASLTGDITGWYGYLNKDTSNFCVIYNYKKWDGTNWVDLPTNRAPIVPGRYKTSYQIIPGDNYLIQNTIISDSEFTIVQTDFNLTDSSSLAVVYNGSDHSANSDLKLTITNSASNEMVITYVYYSTTDGKYYDYSGAGEISIDPATYDETKGLIFEKYFYKYTRYGDTVAERELDTTTKLVKDEIKNAGYYEVQYKLIYPRSSNYSDFFVSNLTTTFGNPNLNNLSRTVEIEKAYFSAISNDLSGPELGIKFFNAAGQPQTYIYHPYIAENDYVTSKSSVENPIVSISQGYITIQVLGTAKANLQLEVFREVDSFPITFNKVADGYLSAGVVPVGNYFFVLNHEYDSIQNYYESVPVYFRVVEQKISLGYKTENLTLIDDTDDYSLNGTNLKFNFLDPNVPTTVIMEYNYTEEFEQLEILYKWINSGALSNPTFKVSYYEDVNCSRAKVGALSSFSHGEYYALIDIDSTEYAIETPFVVKIVITKTSDYDLSAANASFAYGEYDVTALRVDARHSTDELLGNAIFFSDNPDITPDYLDLMNQFILDNTDENYQLRTEAQVSGSSVGTYYAVGLFIPTNASYNPKAFGYRYTVTKHSLDEGDLVSIEIIPTFTAPVRYDGTSSWVFDQLVISPTTQYQAKIKVAGEADFVEGYAELNVALRLDASRLATYFDKIDNGDPVNWSDFYEISSIISFVGGDYSFSGYIPSLSTKLKVNIVRPSLTTVITSISSETLTYNGVANELDIRTLRFNFATITNNAGTPYDPQPLTSFDDVITKIYGGVASAIAELSSLDLTYTSTADYVYSVTTTETGSYTFAVTFAESNCFAETTFNVSYNINKINAGSLGQIRYNNNGDGASVVDFQTRGFTIDYWGEIEGDSTPRFRNRDNNIMLQTELNNAWFEIYINGEWRTLTDEYAASIMFKIHETDTDVPILDASMFTRSESIPGQVETVTITVEFNANSVVSGTFTLSFEIEYYVSMVV